LVPRDNRANDEWLLVACDCEALAVGWNDEAEEERERNDVREVGRDALGLGDSSDVRVKNECGSCGFDLDRQLSVGRTKRDTTSGTTGMGLGTAAGPRPRAEDLAGGPADRDRGGLRRESAKNAGCSNFGPLSNSCNSRPNLPTPDHKLEGGDENPGR
jgi:hypothetical protein